MHGDAREKRQMNPLLLYISQKSRIFAHAKRQGLLAERLGTGLQNRLLQFESGRDLQKFSLEPLQTKTAFFVA